MLTLYPKSWGLIDPPSPGCPVDWPHPLAQGMVLCLLLHPGIKWYDRSALGNHGTLNGNPLWAGSSLGPAINFDGVNDYVDCGSNSSLSPGSGSFTFAAWVQSNSLNAFALSSRTSSSTTGFDILIGSAGNAGQWTVRASDGTTSVSAPAATGLNDNKSHLIAGVIDKPAGLLRLYVDGTQISTVSLGAMGSITNAAATQVGARSGASFAAGPIGPVYCYARALSAGEVAQLFNDPYAMILAEPPGRNVIGPRGVLVGDASVQCVGDVACDSVGVRPGSASLQGVGTTAADGILAGSSSLIVTGTNVSGDATAESGQGDSIDITSSGDAIGRSGGRA